MAGFGRLPGVGLSRRRSQQTHHRQWWNPPPPLLTTIVLDDEAADNARKRLEKKLGYSTPSPRSSSNDHAKVGSSSSRPLGRSSSWGFFFTLYRNEIDHHEKDVCAICLENFEAEDQKEESIMELTCAHKFHSHCVSPWLDSHPDCPYCRSNVYVC